LLLLLFVHFCVSTFVCLLLPFSEYGCYYEY
jgi:hypothetical protein